MAILTRTEAVTTPDGTFSAHVALPPSGSGPGILLLQEIFGVNDYLTAVADRLAELGYVVLAPDLFWRFAPDSPLEQTEEGIAQAFSRVATFDIELGVADSVVALEHLRSLDEVTGDVGVLGFCLGGSLAFAVAAATDPAVAVSYYGSGVADSLGAADAISCPLIFHFGAEDPFIPNEHVDAVEAAFATRDEVVLHRYAAGHAFDNHLAPQFSDPPAAAEAWARTTDFLAEHLPA
jgi:carboxymethylenebutenolidase